MNSKLQESEKVELAFEHLIIASRLLEDFEFNSTLDNIDVAIAQLHCKIEIEQEEDLEVNK